MKLVVVGVCVALAGFLVLLAMVVRVIEPRIALSLAAYAAAFAGMMLAVGGIVRRTRRARPHPPSAPRR
jgi:hypothetical protein